MIGLQQLQRQQMVRWAMDDGNQSFSGERLFSPPLSGDRGGLDSAPWLRAGPARLIDQEITTFIVQTRSHLTPLSTPDDTNVDTGRSRSCSPGDLSLSAGTAGRLSGDCPPGLAAVAVQSDNLTGPCHQLTFSQDVVVDEQEQQEGDRSGSQSPDQPEELHEGDTRRRALSQKVQSVIIRRPVPPHDATSIPVRPRAGRRRVTGVISGI